MEDFKKFTTAFIYSILFLWVTESHAWVYVDTPRTLTENPNPIECRRYSNSVRCENTVKERIPLLTAENDGRDHRVTDYNPTLVLRCTSGYCKDINNGDYLGRYTMEGNRTFQARLPFGYYLVNGENGEPYAYQMGTGPLGNQFTRPWIVEEIGHYPEGNQATTSTTTTASSGRWTETYHLWCNPRGNYCMGLGEEEFSREELPDHYPIVDVPSENGSDYYCSLETCHRKSDDKVIGLNPHYHMWD